MAFVLLRWNLVEICSFRNQNSTAFEAHLFSSRKEVRGLIGDAMLHLDSDILF